MNLRLQQYEYNNQYNEHLPKISSRAEYGDNAGPICGKNLCLTPSNNVQISTHISSDSNGITCEENEREFRLA